MLVRTGGGSDRVAKFTPIAVLGLCLKPLAAILLPGSENRIFVGVDHHYAGRKTKRPLHASGRGKGIGLRNVLDPDGKFGRHAVGTRGDPGYTQNQTCRYA